MTATENTALHQQRADREQALAMLAEMKELEAKLRHRRRLKTIRVRGCLIAATKSRMGQIRQYHQI